MKVTIEHGYVTLREELGKHPDTGEGLVRTRTMELEQYEKHARDPELVKAIGQDKHAEILAALELERQAAGEASGQ